MKGYNSKDIEFQYEKELGKEEGKEEEKGIVVYQPKKLATRPTVALARL